MNTILSLDTSSEAYSVAVAFRGGRVYEHFYHAPRQAALDLLPTMDTLLAKTGLTLSDMDAIVTTIGPGSFTGLRLAVSVAQGLAWANSLQTLGLNTLEVLAWDAVTHHNMESVLVAIDARKSEAYWGVYQKCEKLGVIPVGDIQLSPPSAIKVSGVDGGIGTAFHAFAQLGDHLSLNNVLTPRWPKASCAAQLALLREPELSSPSELQPLYVRNDIL